MLGKNGGAEVFLLLGVPSAISFFFKGVKHEKLQHLIAQLYCRYIEDNWVVTVDVPESCGTFEDVTLLYDTFDDVTVLYGAVDTKPTQFPWHFTYNTHSHPVHQGSHSPMCAQGNSSCSLLVTDGPTVTVSMG